MSSNRFDEKFKSYLKPWKQNIENKPILVVGQVPTDASLAGVDIKYWYLKTIDYYLHQGHQVIFRKHPLDKNKYNYPFMDTNITLEETLQQVSNCVTYCSNSGVISVLEGIPTIAISTTSMVYNLVPNNIKELNQTPDRTQWCNDIAYTQWTLDEISSGLAWKHLKVHFENTNSTN